MAVKKMNNFLRALLHLFGFLFPVYLIGAIVLKINGVSSEEVVLDLQKFLNEVAFYTSEHKLNFEIPDIPKIPEISNASGFLGAVNFIVYVLNSLVGLINLCIWLLNQLLGIVETFIGFLGVVNRNIFQGKLLPSTDLITI